MHCLVPGPPGSPWGPTPPPARPGCRTLSAPAWPATRQTCRRASSSRTASRRWPLRCRLHAWGASRCGRRAASLPQRGRQGTRQSTLPQGWGGGGDSLLTPASQPCAVPWSGKHMCGAEAVGDVASAEVAGVTGGCGRDAAPAGACGSEGSGQQGQAVGARAGCGVPGGWCCLPPPPPPPPTPRRRALVPGQVCGSQRAQP